jgi:hypothetical protein
MEYKCQTVSMSRMIVGSTGFLNTLCENCCSMDCSNPIEKTKLSILGVEKEVKVFNGGTSPRFVVQCEGHMPK